MEDKHSAQTGLSYHEEGDGKSWPKSCRQIKEVVSKLILDNIEKTLKSPADLFSLFMI